MYIKFCRSYGGDKKDEAGANLSPESKLSVELEGEKVKQTEGNLRLYRAGCILLTVICLVLLLVVIILSAKPHPGPGACPEREESARRDLTCSYEDCQNHFPEIRLHYRSCRQCADGWLTFGQSCFFLSTYRLNWAESAKNCTAKGGSLAVIDDQKLQNFLSKQGKMHYWIGLRQNSDKWTWVGDTEVQASYWADNRGNGECGILKSQSPPEKNWATGPCQAYTYFICQLKM